MVKRKGKGGTQGATGQLARIIIRDRLWAAVVDITNPPKTTSNSVEMGSQRCD